MEEEKLIEVEKEDLDIEKNPYGVSTEKAGDLVYIELPEKVVGDTKFFTEEEYLKDKEYITSAEKIEGGLRLGITPENHQMMVDSLRLWVEASFLTLSDQIDIIEKITINEDYNRIEIVVTEEEERLDEVIETLAVMLEFVYLFEGNEIDFEVVALNTSGGTVREIKYP